MAHMKRSDALRLIEKIEARRDRAIEEGDFDTAAEADIKIAELREAIDRASPAPKGGAVKSEAKKKKPGCLVVGLAVLALFYLVGEAGGDPEPRTPEERQRAEVTAREDAERRAEDAARVTPIRLEIAAEYALQAVARNPDSVEIESCGVPNAEDRERATAPLEYTCVYRAQNGFGGMNRATATLIYVSQGNAIVTAAE